MPNSLGYIDPVCLHKTDIAILQLKKAIELFVVEDFVCSLTLAGAAEEILGGLSRAKGMKTVTEESVDYMNVLFRHLDHAEIESKERKSIYNKWNFAKNKVKHHDKNDDDVLMFNTCDEAYWMIKRAIANGKMLGILAPNEQDFENWVIEKCCL